MLSYNLRGPNEIIPALRKPHIKTYDQTLERERGIVCVEGIHNHQIADILDETVKTSLEIDRTPAYGKKKGEYHPPQEKSPLSLTTHISISPSKPFK